MRLRLTPRFVGDPSFATKVAETKLGVTGGPAWMAQQRAEKALTDAGQPIPRTPHDPRYLTTPTTYRRRQADETHAKNLQEFKDSGVEDFSTSTRAREKREHGRPTAKKYGRDHGGASSA